MRDRSAIRSGIDNNGVKYTIISVPEGMRVFRHFISNCGNSESIVALSGACRDTLSIDNAYRINIKKYIVNIYVDRVKLTDMSSNDTCIVDIGIFRDTLRDWLDIWHKGRFSDESGDLSMFEKVETESTKGGEHL